MKSINEIRQDAEKAVVYAGSVFVVLVLIFIAVCLFLITVFGLQELAYRLN